MNITNHSEQIARRMEDIRNFRAQQKLAAIRAARLAKK